VRSEPTGNIESRARHFFLDTVRTGCGKTLPQSDCSDCR
jgi:hypothetical protein